MQFGNQVAEVGRKLLVPSRLLGSSRSSADDVHQGHRQLLLAKSLNKLTGVVYDTGYRMERRYVSKASLKIHHDQRSLRVKHSKWQIILLGR